MKARAEVIRHSEPQTLGGHVEHITIDGEPEISAAPTEQPHRITLHSYTLPSRPHGSITELSILEGHFLGVRCARPGSRPRKYQFDLRFANPTPVCVRHIPWAWLFVATGLAALGYGALASAWSAGISALSPGLIGGVLATSISITALYFSLRRTTESLQFRSVHGGATLVSVTGGVGSTRRHKKLFIELGRDINAARLARPQQKPQFLRDEMREHYCLRQLGVLSDKEYEASKARILAAHQPET